MEEGQGIPENSTLLTLQVSNVSYVYTMVVKKSDYNRSLLGIRIVYAIFRNRYFEN